MTPKFKLGDQVWRPTFQSRAAWITCPDCGGTGRLRVTFHDETTVSIECQNCAKGFEPPTGKVHIYERTPEAHMATVSGMEIEAGKITYRLSTALGNGYIVEEDSLATDHAEALVKARAIADEAAAEELRRIHRKEKDTRTWAWNASYHRKEIKRAERQIIYHTAKLNAANLKAREETKR